MQLCLGSADQVHIRQCNTHRRPLVASPRQTPTKSYAERTRPRAPCRHATAARAPAPLRRLAAHALAAARSGSPETRRSGPKRAHSPRAEISGSSATLLRHVLLGRRQRLPHEEPRSDSIRVARSLLQRLAVYAAEASFPSRALRPARQDVQRQPRLTIRGPRYPAQLRVGGLGPPGDAADGRVHRQPGPGQLDVRGFFVPEDDLPHGTGVVGVLLPRPRALPVLRRELADVRKSGRLLPGPVPCRPHGPAAAAPPQQVGRPTAEEGGGRSRGHS
mmetsp:Transcript_46763/g.150279  ORF Transcript_46763/g.150279 Transcript_46763/m.150279 type:complete len:275 (-) Transcript_46763:32-856(-)